MSKRKTTGLPPGSLVFTGERFIDKPNVTLIQYNASEIREEHLKNEKPTLMPGDYISWFDVRGVHDIALVERIGKRFDIHPLILEDVLDTQQRPKFEEYKNGIYLTIRALSLEEEKMDIHTEQISIYLGKDFVVSFQENDDDLFVAVRNRLNNSEGNVREKGADFLAYILLDTIVDNYYLILDKMEQFIENLEEEILSDFDEKTKAKIHLLKLETLTIRKAISPLKDAISKFSKTEHSLIDDSSKIFIRDLYDHTNQIMDMTESGRDMLNHLYDLYQAELSHKMNNIMKVLTVISTVFIPLTFLTGLYGMNFTNMPELQWRYGYFVLLAMMLLISFVLIVYFKKKKWL